MNTAPALTLIATAVLVMGGCSTGLAEPDPGLDRMVEQPRGAPYRADDGAQDGAMMQAPPAGTVSREADLPGPLTTGMDARGYLDHLPIPADAALLDRGQDRFNLVCATCHGVEGDGVSPVAEHMETVKPRNLHDPRIRVYPVGRIFQVASDGFGLMASQADLLDVRDRWAVAAYVKALQLSRHAELATLPDAQLQRARERLP